jgi:hypothetical protein
VINRSAVGAEDVASLSPLEHVFSGTGAYGITLVFSFSARLDRDRLQESLAQTVARFPWIWCCLEESFDRRSLRLSPRRDPVVLETGSCASAHADKDQFVGPLDPAVGSPLARFCLTDTPSGSVLGVRISHAMTDGSSLFHFLVSWAQLTRGLPVVDPVRVPLAFKSGAVDDSTAERVLSEYGLFSSGKRESVRSDALKEELLYLGPAEVTALRDRAQRESGARLSVNDVLTAHLWQRLGPNWCQEMNESESILSCPVDMRAAAGLPWNHFGCVIGFAVTRLEVERLRRAQLGELALQVRQAVQALNAESLPAATSVLEHLRQKRGLAGVQNFQVRHPRGGMLITNVTRAPLAELDFGQGAPISFISDASQYHAASLFTHPEGIQVRVMPRPTTVASHSSRRPLMENQL